MTNVLKKHPELEDRLISAIQLSRAADRSGENSPELVRALLEEAGECSRRIDFRRILVYRNVFRVALFAAVLVVFFSSLVYVDHRFGPAQWGARLTPIYLNRIVGGSAAWPKKIRLVVLDFPENRRFSIFFIFVHTIPKDLHKGFH